MSWGILWFLLSNTHCWSHRFSSGLYLLYWSNYHKGVLGGRGVLWKFFLCFFGLKPVQAADMAMLSASCLLPTSKKPLGWKYSREWLSGFPGPSEWRQEFGVSKNENDHCVYLQKYFVGLLSWGRWQMCFQRKGTNCEVPSICSFSLSDFTLNALQWTLLFFLINTWKY